MLDLYHAQSEISRVIISSILYISFKAILIEIK